MQELSKNCCQTSTCLKYFSEQMLLIVIQILSLRKFRKALGQVLWRSSALPRMHVFCCGRRWLRTQSLPQFRREWSHDNFLHD